jgi:DNA-binding NarL/FixJ family response regulator
VADGHYLSAKVLERYFNNNESVNIVGIATEGSDIRRKMSESPIDVLLLDLTIPQLDGLQIISYVRSVYPRVKVIVYSNINESDIIHRAFELGAVGYLTKDAEYDKVDEAIRFAHEGGKFLCRQPIQSVDNGRYYNLFMNTGRKKGEIISPMNN